jgi:hypothetical protein
MQIQFFDDPGRGPRSREDVRFNQLGLYVYEDGRRVAVGFDITPFLERPSIEVTVVNEAGQPAASLSVIEAMQPNFHLTLHLRDDNPTENYQMQAELYYMSADGDRMVVDSVTKGFNALAPGEQ